MRKKAIVCLLLSFLLLASGCTEKPVPLPEPDRSAPESQIRLFAETRETWQPFLTDSFSGMVFTLTDLDQNGRLELILTYIEGTGLFSRTVFFEVNASFDGISAVWLPDGEDVWEVDLASFTTYRCLEENGVYYYVGEDVIRNGYDEAIFEKSIFCLMDGTLTNDLVGGIEARIVRNEDALTLETAYFDAGGHNINREAFDAMERSYLSLGARELVMELEWFRYDPEEFETQEKAEAKLTEAQGTFRLLENAAAPRFHYPSDYYGMEEKALSGIGDDGMFAFPYWKLCKEWTLVSAEIEGWEWNAEEEGVESTLLFAMDGTASFFYNDEYENKSVFDGMELKAIYAPLYEGCGNEEWYVEFSGDEENLFLATQIEGEAEEVIVFWYQGPYTEEEYPAVCTMYYRANEAEMN